MATVFDVESIQVTDPDLSLQSGTVAAVTNIAVTAQTPTAIVEVQVAGPQGVQNLYVGTTAPTNPQVNWVWIDTT